jgi:Protein of unknown function (DUF1302)
MNMGRVQGARSASQQRIAAGRRAPGRSISISLASLIAVVGVHSAHGFEFNTDNPDVKVRWDNTLKYSAAFRLRDRSDTLTTTATPPGANVDDGDRNFDSGVISNRLDLLSELDASYRNFGVRFSGAGWYDTVYNSTNDNNSPNSANAASVPYNHFSNATRDVMGRYIELLDAFFYGKGNIGGLPASFRLGKHTLLYGESLFFGANGIAGTQSPVDIVKAVAVPNSQFKEFIRPVPQASGQIALLPNLTVGGYYQFRWERNRLPPVGSYFSFVDILDKGGERLIAATPVGALTVLRRSADQEAKNSGQFGAQVKYRAESYDGEWGLYFSQFHSKNPVVYNRFYAGEYNLVYPENIKVYGASFSTAAIEAVQLSTEVSLRTNMPLTPPGGSINLFVPTTADNNDNPAYAVGRSAHAQVSGIYSMPRTPLWQGGFLLGEIAWNRKLSVTRNPGAIDPNATRDASALWLSIQPQYFQVISGLDLTVPIGLTYGIDGKSSVVDFSPAAPYHGGNVSVGLTGTYRNIWISTLNYTHYYGAAGQVLDSNFNYSYRNVWADRDFVSLSIQRTL